jgi:hypothetical protein
MTDHPFESPVGAVVGWGWLSCERSFLVLIGLVADGSVDLIFDVPVGYFFHSRYERCMFCPHPMAGGQVGLMADLVIHLLLQLIVLCGESLCDCLAVWLGLVFGPVFCAVCF